MRITPICLVLGVFWTAQASAQDVPPVSGAPMGMHAVMRGVQGPAGLFHSRILLHINSGKNQGGKPISLAPDLYYSFTDTFQMGLIHNLPMGWQTLPGAGLCLTGKDSGCPKVYDNVGVDALIGLAFGDFHFSLHSSFYALKLSAPRWFMLTLGAAGKFHFSDTLALFFDPQVGIALTERDRGNPNRFFLPLELQFQLSPTTAFKLLSGVTGRLSNFSDTYQVPLGAGVIFNINENIDLGGRFSFDNLLGKVPPTYNRTDFRSISLLMHLRV
jgi:hypothetical protein